MNSYQLEFGDWRVGMGSKTACLVSIDPESDWSDEVVFLDARGEIGAENWIRKTRLESAAGATAVRPVPAVSKSVWWKDAAVQGEVQVLGSVLAARSAVFIFRSKRRGRP